MLNTLPRVNDKRSGDVVDDGITTMVVRKMCAGQRVGSGGRS